MGKESLEGNADEPGELGTGLELARLRQLEAQAYIVVHHGGSGTTHTASRAGVPQVVVPHVLDQFYFERRLHMLGVAPPGIPRGKLTPMRLALTLGAVLDNELIADRARELSEQLAALGPTAPDAERVLRI